jgi:precorrin-2 dehydrogenase/sirohydrochlorin ferrochelatase
MAMYYPLYLRLTGKRCLVVGGGPVAERKTHALLEAEAQVTVVSPEATPQLELWAKEGRVEWIRNIYRTELLAGVCLVFAATNSRQVNAQVIQEAAAQGIFSNSADAPEEADFITPSVVRRGDLCVSIATGGNNPMLTARLCAELEARFGPEYAGFVELLGQMRHYIKENYDSGEARHAALTRLLDTEQELLDLLRQGKTDDARTLAKERLRE